MSGAAWTLAMLYTIGGTLIVCSFIPWVRRSRRVPLHRRVRAVLAGRRRVPADGTPLTSTEQAAWVTAKRAFAIKPHAELRGYERKLEALMRELTGGGE